MASHDTHMEAEEDARGEKRSGGAEVYQEPPKRHQIKGRAEVTVPVGIPVSNRYEALAPQEPDVTQNEKIRPPPPIIIKPPISLTSLRILLRELNIEEYSSNSSKQETRLYLATEVDHNTALQALLREKKVEFHTFAPRGTKRTQKFVLYGFDVDYDVKDIIDELKRVLPGFRLARRLTKQAPNGERYDIEAIQIIVDHFVKIEDIRNLGAINRIKFRVTSFKEDIGPVQCRNCQEYGHTMKYCGRTCHCAWCGDHHLLAQCPKNVKPYCSNCKGDHPAFSKECSYRKKIIDQRRNQKKKKEEITTPPPTRKPSQLVKSGLEYSAVIGGSTSQSQQPAHPHHHDFPQSSPHPSATPLEAAQPSKKNEQSTLIRLVEGMLQRLDQMMGFITTLLNTVLSQQKHD